MDLLGEVYYSRCSGWTYAYRYVKKRNLLEIRLRILYEMVLILYMRLCYPILRIVRFPTEYL